MSTDVGSTSALEKLIGPMFFVSGAAALSYEVVWFKQFSHIWGHSTPAMAAVVGAFLLGLGLGAHFFGSLADRFDQPLRWYGIAEVTIGVLAFLVPHEAAFMTRFGAAYYTPLRDYPLLYAMMRCAITFLVIGPPSILMGATLPLLVSASTFRQIPSRTLAWLYGLNTFGAAFGCYVVGFHLLPAAGLPVTNAVTAIGNIAIGLLAIVLSKPRARPADVKVAPGDRDDASSRSTPIAGGGPVLLYSSAALAGCAALILQTVWHRQLALVLGGSTYAFSAMLTVILLGIAIGSLLLYLLSTMGFLSTIGALSTMRSATHAWLPFIVAGAVISTIAGHFALPMLANGVGALSPLRSSYVANAVICLLVSAAVELIPAVAMGMVLPALIDFAPRDASHLGRTVARLYAFNTAGTLLGSTVTSIVLIPAVGTHGAVVVALSLYTACLLMLSAWCESKRAAWCASGVAVVAICAFGALRVNPLALNYGRYLYGFVADEDQKAEIIFFREGAVCNVLVSKADGTTSLRVDGKVDGSNASDMAMQLGLAYIPKFLNPDAKDVLVIGFGTGTTSGASLQFPQTSVTCCEIEPAVVAAAPAFIAFNHRPQDSQNFAAIYDDAGYIEGTTNRFDLILSEPSNPWMAGVSGLFTVDFYRSAARRLTDGGILAQWIQTYSFAGEDYAMIVRSIGDAFEHYRLIRISEFDTILLASKQPLDRDAEAIARSQRLVDQTNPVTADLKRYFGTTDVATILLKHIRLDEGGLQRLAGATRSDARNLDTNLRLEFEAARHMYERHAKSLGRLIMTSASSEWPPRHFERLGAGLPQVPALHQIALSFLEVERFDEALKIAEFGLVYDPDSPELLADGLIASRRIDPARLDRLIGSDRPTAPGEANRVGVSFGSNGQFRDALTVFERLSARYPNSATIWTNIATTYRAMGNPDAAPSFRRALEIDPVNEYVIRGAASSAGDSPSGSDSRAPTR